METIQELNSKWWYRLLKVVTIFAVLMAIIGAIAISFASFPIKVDEENSYIVCDDGRKSSLSDVGVTLYSDYVSSWDDEKFERWCFISQSGTRSLTDNYTLTVYHTSRDWLKIISYSALSIIVIFLLTEISRRVFYYITLGKIRPPMN